MVWPKLVELHRKMMMTLGGSSLIPIEWENVEAALA